MATRDSIPVVDFKDVLSCTDLSTCAAVQELHSAFTTVGFVFIKNHGIDKDLINRLNSVAIEFFDKPHEIKMKSLYCNMDKDTKHNGYMFMCQEKEKIGGPGDHHEAFDICSIKDCNYPDEDVPQFRHIVGEYFRAGMKLARLILELMGHALKPKDPLFFVRHHAKIGNGCDENYSTARVMIYPPIPQSYDFSKFPISSDGHVYLRKREHVDYGSLTLLLPDPKIGGLQVIMTWSQKQGSFIAKPDMLMFASERPDKNKKAS